jgi:hypothetical protein
MVPFLYIGAVLVLIGAIFWTLWMRSDTQENRKYTIWATTWVLGLQIFGVIGAIYSGNFGS